MEDEEEEVILPLTGRQLSPPAQPANANYVQQQAAAQQQQQAHQQTMEISEESLDLADVVQPTAREKKRQLEDQKRLNKEEEAKNLDKV